jgi:hypothetical protein
LQIVPAIASRELPLSFRFLGHLEEQQKRQLGDVLVIGDAIVVSVSLFSSFSLLNSKSKIKIHRCYVVWQSFRIVILPVLLWLGNIGASFPLHSLRLTHTIVRELACYVPSRRPHLGREALPQRRFFHDAVSVVYIIYKYNCHWCDQSWSCF